jgi:hypothetical protein
MKVAAVTRWARRHSTLSVVSGSAMVIVRTPAWSQTEKEFVPTSIFDANVVGEIGSLKGSAVIVRRPGCRSIAVAKIYRCDLRAQSMDARVDRPSPCVRRLRRVMFCDGDLVAALVVVTKWCSFLVPSRLAGCGADRLGSLDREAERMSGRIKEDSIPVGAGWSETRRHPGEVPRLWPRQGHQRQVDGICLGGGVCAGRGQ